MLSKSATLLLTLVIAQLARADEPFRPPLFAFQNGVAFGSFDDEARALKELGYDGVGSVSTNDLDKRIAAYDALGLKVFRIYVGVGSDRLPEAIELLENRNATIELTVQNEVNAATVKSIQELADLAAKANVRIAIYPHAGFAIATIDPALALIEKVDRPNVGLMFNLCHFLKGEDEKDLEATIKKAAPKIFAVSTCGADNDGRGWNTLIQPLDRGTFAQARLFSALRKNGFQGAVGIQCYAIRGDKRENLARSKAAWDKLMTEVNKQ